MDKGERYPTESDFFAGQAEYSRLCKHFLSSGMLDDEVYCIT